MEDKIVNMFLNIPDDDIEGQATATHDGHLGWIEIKSVTSGVSNTIDPLDPKASNNRCNVSAVVVTKDVDMVSPLLAVYSAGGKCWKDKKAEIHVLDKEKADVAYTINLYDPAITAVNTAWYGDGQEETVVIACRKIEWKWGGDAETWYDRKNQKKSYQE